MKAVAVGRGQLEARAATLGATALATQAAAGSSWKRRGGPPAAGPTALPRSGHAPPRAAPAERPRAPMAAREARPLLPPRASHCPLLLNTRNVREGGKSDNSSFPGTVESEEFDFAL